MSESQQAARYSETSLTPHELRRAFGLIATGVTIVTARKPDGAPAGVTANSVTSVSLEPPMLLWSLSGKSSSIDAFAVNAPFAVHILAESQANTALAFARPGEKPFADDVDSIDAAPSIEGAIARFECTVETVHPGGDHVIIIGRIARALIAPEQPLLFHAGRFGRFLADRPAPDPFPLLRDEWW